jgi:hypothetical protein
MPTLIAAIVIMAASSEYHAVAAVGPPPLPVDWACTNEHFWSVGPHFQVFQFDEWQDAQGQPCERTNAVQQPTYTLAELYFSDGRYYRYRVRMPVWQIGICVLLLVSAVAILPGVFRRRTRRSKHGHAV